MEAKIKLINSFNPSFYNKHSKILILGSFPSETSRKYNFYYQHPQNRFWKILGSLFNDNILSNYDFKENIKIQQSFLIRQNIVLWDIIGSCEAKNSSDENLKNIQENDILSLLKDSNIKVIFLNGLKATKTFYKKYKTNLMIVNNQTKQYKLNINNNKIEIFSLLSTSSANAKYSFDELLQNWQIIKKYV